MGGVTQLEIRAQRVLADLEIGGSVAVNGACLSATSISEGSLTVDVIPETLRRTNLHQLRPGSAVNLERSLALGDRIEGHWVQGHVDAVTRLRSRRTEADRSERFEFELPADLAKYVVEKGSITLDGISLTVGEVDEESFAVYLIPHTLALTTLRERQPGSLINLEVDILAKYVERLLQSRSAAGRPPGRGEMPEAAGRGIGALLNEPE
jgi:riboflavin synthase